MASAARPPLIPPAYEAVSQRITLIGGSARVGKSTLAYRVSANVSTELIHLDHLLSALCSVASEKDRDDLKKAPSINACTPKEWLDELRARDRVLWRGAQAYVAAAQGGPIIVEGGLWPDWLPELSEDHTAVFLVDIDGSPDRLVQIAKTNPRSWMAQRKWPEEKVRRWAEFNRYRSIEIADLACRYGYPVFDTAAGIDQAHERAIAYLAEQKSAVPQSS